MRKGSATVNGSLQGTNGRHPAKLNASCLDRATEANDDRGLL
jgi:hypothetical protein